MIVDIFFLDPTPANIVAVHGYGADVAAMRILRELGYQAVARFDLEDFDLAWKSTNHIAEDWRDLGKRDGTLLWATSVEVRSSMVGDIYLTDKGPYLVASAGFHLLPDETLPFLKAVWEKRIG